MTPLPTFYISNVKILKEMDAIKTLGQKKKNGYYPFLESEIQGRSWRQIQTNRPGAS